MTFTYTDTLLTDRDKVRFHLGDTTENSGPKPAGANFTDEEIAGLVTSEGSWQRAVAAGCEALAATWSTQPSFQADGLQVSQSDIAQRFQDQAKLWRRRHGGASRVGSRAPTRVDGYSQDVDAHET